MSKRNYSNLSKKDLQNVLRSTNANIIKTFCETGSVDRKKFMKRKIIIHETNQRRKRHRQSPHIRLRQFTREASISVSSVFRMVQISSFSFICSSSARWKRLRKPFKFLSVGHTSI